MTKCWALCLLVAGCVTDPAPDELVPQWAPPQPPLYKLRIHGIATSDSNGDNASPVTAATIEALLPELDEIYRPSRIQIVFDPATDFEQRNSTLLNQRFATAGNLEAYTDPAVKPPSYTVDFDNARRNAADEHRDAITVFFAAPLELAYSSASGHWVLVPDSGGGSSGRFGRSVSWKYGVDAPSLAHEIGHYLHNRHTFVGDISTVAEAATAIGNYLDAGHPVADGLQALDGDRDYVRDTPADAAGSIFVEQFGDKCGPDGEIEIPVTYGLHHHATFTLAPDRDLVMSYFKGCGLGNRFSPDQTTRLLDGLTLGNRRGVLHDVSEQGPLASPILEKLDEKTAGSITQIKIARIGVNRVVTATTGTTALKLIVWDASTTGVITRRGDIDVGEVGGTFEVTHGGLNQVIVAYQNTTSGLVVKTYRVNLSGVLTLEDTETASGITDVGLARIDPTTFVTPVRLSTGTLRVIAWSLDAAGTITQQAHGDGVAIDSIEGVTAYHPSDDDVVGAATVFTRRAGNLSVESWKVLSNNWRVEVGANASAGATVSASATELDFDLSASVVRTSTNVQKVIAWRTLYSGSVVRAGSSTTTTECSRITSAAIGTHYLVTACRRSDLKQDIRLFEVSADGATVTPHYDTYNGTVMELAMAPVGSNKVVLATRSTDNTLYVRTFGIAP
ncbi:MAG: hypothetical protein ABI867_02100 [Kofleriaceae bacterium]